MRTFLAILAFLSLTSLLHAQPGRAKTPEQLLPADCVAYFRYDGYAPHRKAYDQTALAKAMKEGLGEFLEHGFSQLFTLTRDDMALGGLKNDEDRRLTAERFLAYVWDHGFAVGAEFAPHRADANVEELLQFTFVLPQGAKKENRQAIDNFLVMVATAFKADVVKAKHADRSGHSFSSAELHTVWWPEGEHVMLTIGARSVEQSLALDASRPRLTSTKWFADLSKSQRYETDMRGYVDLEKLIDNAACVGLEERGLTNLKERFARKVLFAHLGLTGLKDLSFHLGFDGKYQRSTVRLGVVEPAKRTGLLRLLSGTIAFDTAKLPPLPPNADYVSVRPLDWTQVYDYVRSSYGLYAASQLFQGTLPESFPDLDKKLGIDFSKDLLAQLDTTLVTWGAHSEGPFFLGQGFAVKVKDAAKVNKGMQAIAKALKDEEMFAVEKKLYRGQEMYVFSKFTFPMTFALQDDWLVFGLLPQPVQGFLMRRGGQYRVWKAPPELASAFAKQNGKGKLAGVRISDPRPTVEIGLSLMPIYLGVLGGGKIVDATKIPNSQSINEWLFHNTALTYDDGNAIRWEHLYSMNEPDDLLLTWLGPFMSGAYGVAPAILPRRVPKVMPAGPAEAIPPPKKLPDVAAPKQPTLCKATAAEKDGSSRILVKETRAVESMVTGTKAVTFMEKVVVKGEAKVIPKTVYVPYQEAVVMDKEVSTYLIADGNKVQVTRKDGKPVDPKTLPMLLKAETQVVLVRGDMPTAAFLEKLDERTLIIRVVP